MMNLAVVSNVIILGARRVYRKETIQTTQLGYIQKYISEVAVSMERKYEGEKRTGFGVNLCV